MPDEPMVEYGVKELIGELRREIATGFTELKSSMSTKADKIDLAEIRGELKAHGEDIALLKEANRIRAERTDVDQQYEKTHIARRQRRLNYVYGTAIVGATTLDIVLHTFVH